MGGMGSGSHYHWWRSGKKTTVEECRLLDANRWMREGILKARVHLSGSWAWYRDAERKVQTANIGYVVCTLTDSPWIRLQYTVTPPGEQLDYRIALMTTVPRFGGLRWWFICPLVLNGRSCQRRVGKLYLPPFGRYFGCRHCHELTYTSCQESHKFDGLARHMAGQLGWDLHDVKRMMGRMGRA